MRDRDDDDESDNDFNDPLLDYLYLEETADDIVFEWFLHNFDTANEH